MHFTLADLIADITQNGAEAGSDLVELNVSEIISEPGKGRLCFTVKDNGRGMTESELKRARDPFVTDGIKHAHRKVGLGLPFLIQTAQHSGGGWQMESKKDLGQGGGTKVSAWFDLGNVDTPPTGDIAGAFRTALLFDGPAEMVIKRIRQAPNGDFDYEVRKTEVTDALGGLEDARSLILLDKYLRSLEENLV